MAKTVKQQRTRAKTHKETRRVSDHQWLCGWTQYDNFTQPHSKKITRNLT